MQITQTTQITVDHEMIPTLRRMARERGRRAVSMDIAAGCDARGLRAGVFGDSGWDFQDVLADMLREVRTEDAEVDEDVEAALRELFARAYDKAAEEYLATR